MQNSKKKKRYVKPAMAPIALDPQVPNLHWVTTWFVWATLTDSNLIADSNLHLKDDCHFLNIAFEKRLNG